MTPIRLRRPGRSLEGIAFCLASHTFPTIRLLEYFWIKLGLSLHLLQMLFELVIYGTGPWFQKRDSKHGERRNCLGSLLLHLVLLEPLREQVG